MKLFVFVLMLIFGGSAAISAQVKKFVWEDELCRYEGVYNAKKHSAAQLKNTLRLASVAEFGINTDATVWKYEEIDKLSVAALTEEFEREIAELKNLDIVKTPFFEALRQKQLNEMEQSYRAKLVTIEAYTNPKVLSSVKFADVCVQKYAGPLINGGDELLKTWLAVNEDSRAKNGNPANVKRIFDEQMNSPDKLKFARVEVMAFGWWNCANQFTEYVEHDGTARTEFKKLFAKARTVECDEP